MRPSPEPILDLKGTQLGNDWTVSELLKTGPTTSGGFFSVCYLAENKNGKLGFLKAFDFRSAFNAPDVPQALNDMTSSYLFERNLLDFVNDNNIKKVVSALFHGQINKPGAPNDTINYIVFELAEGDSRDQVTKLNRRDFSWSYLALHNVCLALQGLHQHEIFHQDIKPSNILVFDGGNENKLSDFGRSHCDKFKAPHNYILGAGFLLYAPPEHLYHYELPDKLLYKKAGDLYQLASLINFFFTGSMLTPVLLKRLRPEHKPTGSGCWTGNFIDVVPYLQSAFEDVAADLEKQLKDEIPDGIQQQLIPLTMQLFLSFGKVLPENRGIGVNSAHSQYDLQRALSKFDLLSKRALVLGKLNAKTS